MAHQFLVQLAVRPQVEQAAVAVEPITVALLVRLLAVAVQAVHLLIRMSMVSRERITQAAVAVAAQLLVVERLTAATAAPA